MREQRYTPVRCDLCIWQDLYTDRQSQPERCPACGESSSRANSIYMAYPRSIRRMLGRDLGLRAAFGDPTAGYKNLWERRDFKMRKAAT